jgi:DNA (cytosine-5)-methyltransferase 1
LGWKPAWFAEIDAFPSAVLAYHYSGVHNYGDFTKIGADAPAVDVLVGGTPCQSFSVAGVRKGLDDERGNLTLEFLKLAGRIRPRWVVWENVPGVLSIDGGRTFGTFLGGLAELGYGFAYRILDAQYFGVPQRRRRVFVVGCFGDWRRAAAVLFERYSLSGHPAPSRETGQGVSRGFEIGPASGRFTDVAPKMDCRAKDGPIRNQSGIGVAMCLNAGGMKRQDAESETLVSVTIRRLTPTVRRLTPTECERLQGFPDGYTQVPYRGKPAADGPRYKALGNSMAVPVMRWIGERIEAQNQQKMEHICF